jgi:hypothetical protein
MMSGNVCITIRVNRDHHDASALAGTCRSFDGRRRLGRKDEPAAFRHGVARSDRKTEDSRHELCRIYQRGRDVDDRADAKLDAAERGPQQTDRIGQQRIEIDLARLRGPAAREAKHVRCQCSATRRRVIDQFDDRRKLRLVCNGLRQNVDHPGDDGEHIVEVVKNATGELADDGGSLKPVPLRLVTFGRQPMPFLKCRRRLLRLTVPAPAPANGAGPCSDDARTLPTDIR